jgi:hypothetical protein
MPGAGLLGGRNLGALDTPDHGIALEERRDTGVAVRALELDHLSLARRARGRAAALQRRRWAGAVVDGVWRGRD